MVDSKASLTAVIAALDQSLGLLEAESGRGLGALVRPMMLRRRRSGATLRAMLRWYGITPPPTQGRAPVATHSLYALCQSERRLISLYDTAIQMAGQNAPEYRLLVEQRADVEVGFAALSGVLTSARPGSRRTSLSQLSA